MIFVDKLIMLRQILGGAVGLFGLLHVSSLGL